MLIDFKVRKDDFGYYVVAYRVVAGVETRWETCDAMARVLNLEPKDMSTFLADKFGGDTETKNKRVHFATRAEAMVCRDGLRDLIPLAIETNNLYLPS